MTYGVVWEQVYSMPWKLASTESWAFTAYTDDDTTIHGAACYLPDRASTQLMTTPAIGCHAAW